MIAAFILPLVLPLVLSIGSAHGAVRFTAEADRKEIGLDESLTVKLKLTADENMALPEPTISAPDFDEVNSYPQTFLRNMWANGKITTETQMTVTKVLRPRKQGSFQIRDIQVVVKGARLTADSISVKVVGAGRGTPPSSLTREDDRSRKNFMVRAEVNKSRLYHGEQVIISYYLYRRSQLIRPEIRKFPDLADFNKQELEVPVQATTQLEWEDVAVNGQAWSRALLFRYAAYPLKKGEAKVDSAQVEVQVPARSQIDDLFEDSLLQMIPLPGLSTRTVRSTSDPLKLQIVPLPEGGPAGFSGIVGDLDVVAVADKTELKANEALTVTLKLEGRANFSGVTKPALAVPDGIEAFEVRDRTKAGPGGINEKIFEYVLVPRKTGNFKIPGFSIAYFDSEKKQYRTVATEPIEVSVNGSASFASPGTQSQVGGQEELKPDSTGKPEAASPKIAENFGLFVLLGLAIVAMFVWAFRRGGPVSQSKPTKNRRRAESPTPAVPSRGQGARLWREAFSRMDFAGLEEAIYTEVGARLGLESANVRGMPRRDLAEVWIEKKQSDRDWQALLNLLDSLEMARFSGAPTPGDANGPDSPLTKTLTQHAAVFFGSLL